MKEEFAYACGSRGCTESLRLSLSTNKGQAHTHVRKRHLAIARCIPGGASPHDLASASLFTNASTLQLTRGLQRMPLIATIQRRVRSHPSLSQLRWKPESGGRDHQARANSQSAKR